MSLQFGKWNTDGRPVESENLEKIKSVLEPYGSDQSGSYSEGAICILYRAFHTTREAQSETQPFITRSGSVITWDGRLDNRTELVRKLQRGLNANSTDLEIVAAAHEQWGMDCFSRLVGDWAIAVWDAKVRSLILAKDFAGTRHLYYSFDGEQIAWSTILDPLVLFAEKPLTLCEEYIAGWLSFFPSASLTPYVGIRSVPASSLVLLRPGNCMVRKYWNFSARSIRYRSDREYEEHFLAAFSESVRRRLRSRAPVLAELSGGMDSSSIVCVADGLIARGAAETPRLDSLSYYNDSEPNWNERPYFTEVEKKRGRTGCHIDVGRRGPTTLEFDPLRFAATPGAENAHTESAEELKTWMNTRGNRVLLSGTGGDEVTGGVPSAIPEVADLLARLQFRALSRCLKQWALHKRRPWFYLLIETLISFFPLSLLDRSAHGRSTPWIAEDFATRHRSVLRGPEFPFKVWGPLPSYQANIATLELLRRQLACTSLSLEPRCEKRYPFLDRDLLEFLYAIPREQLVRPHQRRSLLRRSLAGIVPHQILNRKRKAFLIRAPMLAISEQRSKIFQLAQHMIAASLGILDQWQLLSTVEDTCNGMEANTSALIRAVTLEYWLRHLQDRNLVRLPARFAPDKSARENSRTASRSYSGWVGQ